MSSGQEMKARLTRLRIAANRVKEGDSDSLRALRRELEEINFDELRNQTDDWHLGILYLTRLVLNDIYGNLGTDAVFGFPPESFLHGLLLEFGTFLELSLTEGPNVDSALYHLSRAMSEFCQLVGKLDQAAQEYSEISEYFKGISEEESNVG